MAGIGVGSRYLDQRAGRVGTPAAASQGIARRDHAVLIGPETATALGIEWGRLAGHAVEDNLFFHPDVMLPAIGHLGEDPRIAVVRDARGRLTGLAPVVMTRLGRIAPAVSIWSHDYGPLGVPLIDRRDVDGAVSAMVDIAGKGSLIVPDLTLEGPVAAALTAAAERSRRPVAIVGGHLRAMLLRPQAGTVDLRANSLRRRGGRVARQMRRLADLGTVTIETTAEPDCVRARFEEFLTLEAAGWKGRSGTALASASATAGFAREMVFNRSEEGAARIDSIRVAEHPIAILVSFVAGATAFTWKIAFDEGFRRFSPGAQLMLEAPRSLFSDPNVARIDSCAAADHPMIDHLWKDRLAVGTLVIGPPSGAIHRLGLAVLRAEVGVRDTARRLRSRLFAGRKHREAGL
ncbi:MAG: GNAT family N-acetyltransferase [Bauldia sp.]|nr:MAG: GNAT family N-acetyltransferase [Bauldia sp.]